MFQSENNYGTMISSVMFHRGIQPEEHLELMSEAIKLLDKCVAAARQPAAKSDKSKESSELILGFALLATSEARALLMLLSAGLERSARIHLRSLFEYIIRSELVLEPQAAIDFRNAVVHETDKFGKALSIDESVLATVRHRYLGNDVSETEVKSEKRALGMSNMASLIMKKSGSASTYATNFSQPSLFSHGSILALYEVAESIKDTHGEFLEKIFRDGQGAMMLCVATTRVLRIALNMITIFSIEALSEWDHISDRNAELSKKEFTVPASDTPNGES